MPALDQTGPQGQGPLTGLGRGKCNNGSFSFSGMGRGRGLKTQCRFNNFQDIQEYKKSLQTEIDRIDKQIAESADKQ